jgi:hypothetical protein
MKKQPNKLPESTAIAGAGLYARQAGPEGKASALPPVDLKQPVENPLLSAALDRFINSHSPEAERELFRQLRSAVFLVPMPAGGMEMTPGGEPGAGTMAKGSTLMFFACADRKGADHLPLFTDWPAIRAWTEQTVSTLVMPAAEAWDFVLSQSHYAGVFINPGSQRLQLNRDFIQCLKDES